MFKNENHQKASVKHNNPFKPFFWEATNITFHSCLKYTKHATIFMQNNSITAATHTRTPNPAQHRKTPPLPLGKISKSSTTLGSLKGNALQPSSHIRAAGGIKSERDGAPQQPRYQ